MADRGYQFRSEWDSVRDEYDKLKRRYQDWRRNRDPRNAPAESEPLPPTDADSRSLHKYFDNRHASYAELLSDRRSEQAFLGALTDNPGWTRFGEPQTHCLVMAPPRTVKTSGVLVPNILLHRGPAVIVSSKPDIVFPTAMLRSMQGRVLIFNLSGEEHPDGLQEIHWSPVAACTTWSRTLKVCDEIIRVYELLHGGFNKDPYWNNAAKKALSCYLFYANRTSRDMAWVYFNIESPTFGDKALVLAHRHKKLTGEEKNFDMHEIMATWFERHGELSAMNRINDLSGYEQKRRDDIYTTAESIISAYADAIVQVSGKPSYFKPADFVRGRPGEQNHLELDGIYDTVYVIAPSSDQKSLAPVVVSFLGSIRDAAYEYSAERRIASLPAAAPVLFAMDELANMAPFPDLPGMLSEGGSQGIQMVGAVQSPSQLKIRWKEEGEAFLAMWQNVLFVRGLGDDVYKKLVELYGVSTTYFASYQENNKPTIMPKDYQTSHVPSDRPNIPIEDLQKGRKSPFTVFSVLAGGITEWLDVPPYHLHSAWPWVMVKAAEQIRDNPKLADLRRQVLPDLARNDDYSAIVNRRGGDELLERWLNVQAAWNVFHDSPDTDGASAYADGEEDD